MTAPQEPVFEEAIVREIKTGDETAIQRLLDKPLSDEDLQEHTRRVAQPLQRAEQDIVRLIVFQVGEELMAIEAVEVHQVIRATPVHRIPHRSNTIIRGLCNLDGNLMLCADVASLLELRSGPDDVRPGRSETATAGTTNDQAWMIVFGDQQNRWVVEVDSVRGVIAFTRKAFLRPPITVDAALARYTTQLVPFEQGTIALLDLQRVVSGFQAALR